MANTTFSQENQFQVIDFLRFPLIIGVIFIHNFSTSIQIKSAVYGVVSGMNMPFMYYCSNFFSNVIARIAVPLFFFMSGFLFFINVDKLSEGVYKNKLAGRIKTLLIPYLFWNFIVFLLYYVISLIPQLNAYINKEVDLHNFFSYFWNNSGENGGTGFPISYQFWFIRDLMMTVLLTPIIYFSVKKSKYHGVLLLGILWYFNWWFHFDGFSLVCIFFFTAGAYFGINKRNLLEDFGKIKKNSFVLYPIIAFADLLTKKYDFNIYIHNAGIIMGIIFCFNVVAFLFEKGWLKSTKFLSAAAFFVFVVHDPFLLIVFRKLSYLIFHPQSDLALTTLYFANPILVIFCAIALYYILKRFLPRFTKVITGGR